MTDGKYHSYLEYLRLDSNLEIPSHWAATMLKRVVDQSRPITYGIVQAGPNITDGTPYIRPADMTDESGVKSYEGLLRTSSQIAANYERSTIKCGDIVCSIGPSFGKLMIVPSGLGGANLTQGTARVAISTAHVPRYFFWQLRSNESYQQWESSVGGATFRALNLGPLAETKIVVPSASEQQQIANFLDHETAKIDVLIDKQQQLIKLLQEKRQAVISRAVTKGLNPDAVMKDSGVEWLGEVPENWVLAKVRYLVTESAAGPYGASLTKPMYTNSGYRVYGQQQVIAGSFEVGDYYISQEKYEEMLRYTVYPGDLLITVMGTIGRVAVVPEGIEKGIINPRLVRYVFDQKRVLPEFVKEQISSSFHQDYLLKAAQGSTMDGLNMGILGGLTLVYPPHDEQREILRYISQTSSKYSRLISAAEKSLELLCERRTALISAAVTGKIDVRNWQPVQAEIPREASA